MKLKAETETLNGILLIDKPILYTSHDIVDVVRHKLGFRRVGHAGVLDPMATGLLVVLLGKCTSLFERLSSHDKRYEGVICLGTWTRTLDLEGEILGTADTSAVSEEVVRNTFEQFTGQIEQEAPQFSSKRIKGVKAYKLARKKQDFSPPVKTVTIQSLELLRFTDPEIYFRTTVSKGTYLRSLASDVGKAVGTGGVLAALRRTASGIYDVKDSLTPKALNQMSADQIKAHSIDQMQKIPAV